MKTSAQIQQLIGMVKPGLDRSTAKMWETTPQSDVYRTWLLHLHGMIRATVPLMLSASDECLRRTDDPVCKPLARYLTKHIHEEFGHDTWAAEDLARAGGKVDISTFLPPPAVAELVGSQYYWIRHAHPVALLGHMAVLEGYPPSPSLPKKLEDMTGLPSEAFMTIERHATLDVKHSAELFRTLDNLPLRDYHVTLVRMSALSAIDGLVRVTGEIARATASFEAPDQ